MSHLNKKNIKELISRSLIMNDHKIVNFINPALTCEIRNSPAIFFNFIVPVEDVVYQLQNTSYNGFPVMSSTG